MIATTRAECPAERKTSDRDTTIMAKKSASDAVLAQQLNETGNPPPKQNVTLAEAKQEAAANSADGTDGTTTAKGKSTKTGDSTPATPRPKIAPGSTPAQVLAAHIPDQPTLYDHARLVKGDVANEETYNNTGSIINKLAKKVAEKAINLVRHRGNPASVQVYTKIGMDMLVKEGEITSKGLTEKFLTKYKPGTARAQANQIMQLFPALKVADRAEKGTLTLNKDSVIVKAYTTAKG